MAGPPKSMASSTDGGLSSRVRLTSLFSPKSRDGDSDGSASDATPTAASAPSALPGHVLGHRSQQTPIKHVKGDDQAESASTSSSGWLLHRKHSEKRKDKPDRLKNALFGHSSNGSPLSKEVKGAVKDDWPMYSGKAEDYEMGEAIGFGATSTVRLATYRPLNQVVAVKVMDFEGSSSIRMMQREVELMSLSKHPNILRVRGDWVTESRLCIATRFIPPGSLLDIMEYGFRDGLDEVTCATILKQACEGMHYLHINGWLHRDIKAGNLLVDEDGTVLISDFGCSSQVFTTPSVDVTDSTIQRTISSEDINLRTRKSFVGTPSWMAPEVVEQRPYDSKADIWSFGITAIEIATGRAPHSLYTPAQILMKTVAEKPPTLDTEGHAHTFSRTYKDMIDTCLKKDASKRPTAEKLLSHAFFKSAKRKSHLVGALLAGLPPVQSRQTRRSRRTSGLSATRNMSVWDFDTSPITDSFKGFTMNHASPSMSSVHTRLSNSHSTYPLSPEDSQPVSPPSAGRPVRRRNNLSSSISIEPLPEVDSHEAEEVELDPTPTAPLKSVPEKR